MNGSGHLGTVLLEEGLITAEALERAIEVAKENEHPLGRVLVDEGFLPEAYPPPKPSTSTEPGPRRIHEKSRGILL